MIKTLILTADLCAAIDSVRRADAAYVRGRMSASIVEIPMLGLAEAVLQAVDEQSALSRTARLARVSRGKPAQVPVVDIEMRRKRSWRA